ncbi:MAG: hypothetical protein QNJ45_17375 [Ardenticatenaceae bacterium]|nr:hypothetical protein [Ardenticatenaceae bacterium]
MGTELNFFHIRDGRVERFADRKPSVSPIRLADIEGGYDQFLNYRDRCQELRDFIYTTAYGEFVIDYDLKVILFFISYSELASDYIRHAHDLLSRISAAWPGWQIHWAGAGDGQTRAYIELSRHDREQTFRHSPSNAENLAALIHSTSDHHKKEVVPEFDSLRKKYLYVIKACQELYAESWQDLLSFELTERYFDAVQTTVLFVSEDGKYGNFHFEEAAEELLRCGNLFHQHCQRMDSYVNQDERFPESLKSSLAVGPDGSSMVIDEVQKRLVIVTPPKSENVARCLKAVENDFWQGWEVIFDLALLMDYQMAR